MSYLTRPAPTTYWISLSEYGRATFPDGTNNTRTRMWLIHTDGSTLVTDAILRVATNNPKSGRAEYRDFDQVRSAKRVAGRTDVETSEGVFTLVRAPCVCGAGAVGMAGPHVTGSKRYRVEQMRSDILDWLHTR